MRVDYIPLERDVSCGNASIILSAVFSLEVSGIPDTRIRGLRLDCSGSFKEMICVLFLKKFDFGGCVVFLTSLITMYWMSVLIDYSSVLNKKFNPFANVWMFSLHILIGPDSMIEFASPFYYILQLLWALSKVLHILDFSGTSIHVVAYLWKVFQLN